MQNLWTQREFPLASWAADISSLLHEPTRVVELVEHLLRLGAEHQVFILESAPGASLRARWERDRVIDLRVNPEHQARALMAWYEPGGRLVENPVMDLGELLRRLLPDPEEVPDGFMERGWSPLELSGLRLVYAGSPLSTERSFPITIGFTVYSDIWFPFVIGSAHPACDLERFFDNRELASRHTPRLNRFLGEAKAAVLEAGATWDIEPTECSPLLRPWIGRHSILLDGPVPELIPADLASP